MALGAAMMVGCADGPSAPVSPDAAVGVGGTSNLLTVDADIIGTTVFTVGPNGGRFNLAGGHKIYFASDAICEPLTSSYGEGTWDAPCQPAKRGITIKAVSWTDASGSARVDFTPDLRFVPSTRYPARVLLQLRDKKATDPNAALFYCPTFGACYDEALADPSLRTYRDPKSGWVFRFVKHFSGYNVSTGRSATLEGDATSLEGDMSAGTIE